MEAYDSFQVLMICERNHAGNENVPTKAAMFVIQFYYRMMMDPGLYVIGGWGIDSYSKNVYKFDYFGEKWSKCEMEYPFKVSRHLSVKLRSGSILTSGGYYGYEGRSSDCFLFTPSARSNMFTKLNNMNKKREYHALVAMTDGRVMCCGGYNEEEFYLDAVEFYNPSASTWTLSDVRMVRKRRGRAVVLQDGNVLIMGGIGYSNYASSCEIYDVRANAFKSVSAMKSNRCFPSCCLLPNGNVFICGGFNDTNGYLATCEEYNPSADTWTMDETNIPSMIKGRSIHGCMLLRDNNTIIAFGGHSDIREYLSSSEYYNITTKKWTLAPSFPHPLSDFSFA
jgi:N-acetylneuraminic acid mutarotase